MKTKRSIAPDTAPDRGPGGSLRFSFRDLAFSFSNQLVHLASGFNLDVHELIRAANHGYPRDVVPLPSPGVGGPCLSKDPYILSALARRDAGEPLSVHGRRINESMHELVAAKVLRKLRRKWYKS